MGGMIEPRPMGEMAREARDFRLKQPARGYRMAPKLAAIAQIASVAFGVFSCEKVRGQFDSSALSALPTESAAHPGIIYFNDRLGGRRRLDAFA
ncbi:MAG TPA: hypothetical protein VMV27_17585 [Candidatus Binataceae bacterium]|nr:hypothetical protein [Candidatus Binataceae bacterium]